METDVVMTIGHKALTLTLVLMLIMLVPALVVGLLVSLFQAATQINEMTLSFIPKLLVTVVVIMFGGPLMLRMLLSYTIRLYTEIPELIG